MPERSLRSRATRSMAIFAIVLGALVFLCAGSIGYWQGWLFLAHFIAWCAWSTWYFLRHDPSLVEHRLAVGPAAEEKPSQKRIQAFNSAAILLLFAGSALDHRFQLSSLPTFWLMFGHLLIAIGFIGCFFVFRENSFASATVGVQENQRVISTGPYRIVRHPMYASVLPLFAGVPLALGSVWGLLLVIPITAGLVARLLDEERHLRDGLPGYRAYCDKVRFRLVPFFW
ncbi:methyltransferase family protein [Rhizobium puerariae]|uniref:Methyltransferase family protein n=1 Tax=Rhizobium puerariae TaxID=1585791 RepID=A0ABV6AH57_9HYPH